MMSDPAFDELRASISPGQLMRLLASALAPAELRRVAAELGAIELVTPDNREERRVLAAQVAGAALQSPSRRAQLAQLLAVDAGAVPTIDDDLCDLLDGRAFARAAVAALLSDDAERRQRGRRLLEQYEALRSAAEGEDDAGAELERRYAALAMVLHALSGEAVELITSPQLAARGLMIALGAATGARVLRLAVAPLEQPQPAVATEAADEPEPAPAAAPDQPPPAEQLSLQFDDDAEALDALLREAAGLAARPPATTADGAEIDTLLAQVETIARLDPHPAPPEVSTDEESSEETRNESDLPSAGDSPVSREEIASWPDVLPLQDPDAVYPKIFRGEQVAIFGGYDKLDDEYRHTIEAFGGVYRRYPAGWTLDDAEIEAAVAEADLIIVLHNALRDVGAVKAVARAKDLGKRHVTHYSISPKSVGALLHQLYRDQRV